MRSEPYLDAGDAHLPQPETLLVTILAAVGIFAPLVAPCTWRYAINEMRNIDEGMLRADRRRSLDHARSLAKITTLVYAFLLVIWIGFHA
jgi:hypothetical protein